MSMVKHVDSYKKAMVAKSGDKFISINWDKNKEKLRQTLKKNPEKQGNIALWGSDNLFPQTLAKIVEESEILPQIIDLKAKAIYSSGVVYGEEYVDEDDGQTHFVRRIHPDIETDLEEDNFSQYVLKAAEEFYTYANVFSQLSFNVPRNKIAHVHCHDATECRLSVQNTLGYIDKCYINANWEDGGNENDSITVETLDPDQGVLEQLRSGKAYSYILPIRTLRRGHKFYSAPLWDGLRTSGYLELANLIPKAKLDLMKQGMKVKWHVEISELYFEWKFGKGVWHGFTDEEKLEKREEELDAFDDVTSKSENSNVLFTMFGWDETRNAKIPGWEIHEIKNDQKGGEFITDLQEVRAVTMQAHGVDPTIFGSGPGKDKTSGAGSDKRYAFNQLAILAKPDFDQIMRPYRLKAAINDWHQLIKGKNTPENSRFAWRTENYRIATLDTGAEIKNVQE